MSQDNISKRLDFLHSLTARREPVNSRVKYKDDLKNQNSLFFKTEGERDSARIIHSAAFRRLQNKMQVLFIGDGDYFRTRLTHTLEVMQIARGIMYYLQSVIENEGIVEGKISKYEIMSIFPGNHVLEAICYAHDIGHPPFGHGGEKQLNKEMLGYGGFEGNAQTLRILTHGNEHSEKNGFNLMKRTILGVMKYPVLYSEVFRKNSKEQDSNNVNANDAIKPPKCIYDTDADIRDWVLEDFSENDRKLFISYDEVEGEHAKSKYKSLDCSIMNIADDIAYACHDLEDAMKIGILTKDTVLKVLVGYGESEEKRKAILEKNEPLLKYLFDHIGIGNSNQSIEKSLVELLDILYIKREFKNIFSKIISFFIQGCVLKCNDNFESLLLRYNVKFKNEMYEKILELFKKDLSYDQVITSYKIKQMEFKGIFMLKNVFVAFKENPKYMPEDVYLEYKMYDDAGDDAGKYRVICDYISGMSDNFLTKMYSKLYTPNYGSVGDLMI